MAKIDLTVAEMYINALPRLYTSMNERIINSRIGRVIRSLKCKKDCVSSRRHGECSREDLLR